MLRYMLGADLCVRVLGNRPEALRERFNREADGFCISTVVLMELPFGAAKSARAGDNRSEVERFAMRLDVLPFDAEAAGHAAEIRATLERRGQSIGPTISSSPATPAAAASSR